MSTAPTFAAGQPPSRFKMVYFLYDWLNDKETDAVYDLVKAVHPNVQFMTLCTPQDIEKVQWEEWFGYIRPFLLGGALIVGIGKAGTVAAYLQERFSAFNLSVIAINSPTNLEEIFITKHPNRVALYSSHYPTIEGRCDWQPLADNSFDVNWLRYGILTEGGGNLCTYATMHLIVAYFKGPNITPMFNSAIAEGEYEVFQP